MNNLNILPNEQGFFGNYGGQFIEEVLKAEFKKIELQFNEIIKDKDFNNELDYLMKNFVGRPSPVYYAKNLSKKYGNEIYLKREDLNHTGAHKINHCLGEALLAKKMGKSKVIGETGAGQHGLALATASALLGLQCDIYMGEVDIEKAKTNVDKMRLLGANIVPVTFGTKTLKEAVDAAFEAYKKEFDDAIYAIGSVVGPHPFPMIVEYFQSRIGKEAKAQFLEQTNTLPDYVVACVGGGSNAIGMFSEFINDKEVNLIGVEPLGKSEKLGENAASMTYGKDGIIHGFKCKVLQNENGEIQDAYSVACGLDYPGVGPKHCYLNEIKRAKYEMINDIEAVSAFYELSKTEGIIPALESSHAVAYAIKLSKSTQGKKILVNLSGRGDKDVDFITANFPQ
ncbi:MAG: tryptophan synthase subunit beta [Candidatus Gastranaerophilales bacterium]|nr:tryptophan synthase subunit beta [Candidatus Gastranaerophilales bacterium]